MVWYKFTTDRSGVHPQAELKSFSDLMQADGYAGHEKLYYDGRVKEVACWATPCPLGINYWCRRKIFENHQTSPTPLTTELLERIASLYRIEAEVRGQPPDIRRQHGQEYRKPKIDELRSVIDDALSAFWAAAYRPSLPQEPMGPKALACGRKRWGAFTQFIDDGSAEIDNNIAERAMRSIAIGRKNWLFAGSKAGGERAAAIYSVISQISVHSDSVSASSMSTPSYRKIF